MTTGRAEAPQIAGSHLERSTRRTVIGMIVAMALIESLSGVTQGYLNPILPALGPVFDISDPTISGLFLISSVSFAVVTPIVSRLGDSYGYRRVLRGSTALVALGVLLMAIVPSLWTVIVGVVLLTLVVGFIPLMMGILRVTSPVHTRPGVSVMIGMLMVTVGVGGLLAGIVGIDEPTKGFWVAVPFAAIAVICTWLLPDAGTPTGEPLAMAPLLACSLGLVGFVTALSMGPEWGWLDARTLLSGIVGLVLLVVWVRLDSRTGAAGRRFVDLRLFALPRIRAVSLATFFFGFASISYFGTNGIFLHADPAATGYGFALSPFQIAVVLAVAALFSLAGSLLTTRAMRVIGERLTLVTAGVLLAASFAVMALGHGSLAWYCAGFAVFNWALGMYQAGTRALSVEGVPLEETSTAAGLNELALSVGIAVGAAVVRLLSAAFVSDTGRIGEAGVLAIWIALGVAALVAAAAAAGYPRRAGSVAGRAA